MKQIKIYKQDGIQKQMHIVALNDEKNKLERQVDELRTQLNLNGVKFKR